jgi:hypothetical protein
LKDSTRDCFTLRRLIRTAASISSRCCRVAEGLCDRALSGQAQLLCAKCFVSRTSEVL